MAETLMFIGAGPFQVPGILKAREMGLTTVAVDGSADAPGLALAHRSHVADIRDGAACLEIARREKIDGVVAIATDVAVPAAALVAETLGLPGPGVAAARVSTDKYLLRRILHEQQIPCPAFHCVESLGQAQEAARAIGYPVVIKPTDNAGSRGVNRVDAADGLPAAYEEARANSRSGAVLVEAYMPGTEVSVEGFALPDGLHILCLSDKIRTPPPHLLDTTVLFPDAQPPALREAIMDVARRTVAASGVVNAPIHMELMLTPDGPKVVEMAARGPGFHVFTKILPHVTGVDGVEQQIRMALGQTPDLTVRSYAGAVLRFPEARPGVVRSVSGVEQARALPGIHDLEIYVKPGDTVKELTSGSARVGHIIAFAESRAAAERIVAQAESIVVIETT